MNPKTGQQHASPNAGPKSFLGQQPGSKGSVGKLMLLIDKIGGLLMKGKKQPMQECGVPLYCHCSQVHSGPER